MNKIINKILTKITANNFEAFLVGGYVRDYILDRESFDIDICTNALPKDIIKIFKLNVDTMENYGSINFHIKNYNIDITTYRIEHEYKNRKPSNIEYTSNVIDDLKRRDFTINTLLMNKKGEIIDNYNALEDIKSGIIKCIGDIKSKLTEDPLRIMRALRLSTILNYKIDDVLYNFIKENGFLLNNISKERKKEEIDKILVSNNAIYGLNLIKELKLDEILELSYNKVIKVNDILGMYVQVNMENYPLPKDTKENINKIKEIIKIGEINNKTIFKYGLYINIVAGSLLNKNIKEINKLYKNLPIKSRKDIKISAENIVKLKNISYNEINGVYEILIEKILNKEIKNNSRNIVKFLKK